MLATLRRFSNFPILTLDLSKETSRMSTTWWLLLLAVTWSSVGLVVALFLGRLFRTLSPRGEETVNRLIC